MEGKSFEFPSEYYAICSSNYNNRRTNNWFCNKPLTAETPNPQDKTVSSSTDESIEEANVDTSLLERDESEDEPFEGSKSDDPDYVPTASESSSESTSSPISDEGLLNKENKSDRSSFIQNDADDLADRETNNELNTPEKSLTTSSTKDKKNSVFCYFCDCYVINFPRHLYRNHESEIEVQKILSLPVVSKERKALLFSLRKKGNYIQSNADNTKPVRKGLVNTRYLPCSFCFGFYSKKNLWRHRKACDGNPNKGASEKGCQSKAQDMLVRHLKVDSELMSKVFPRMRADRVSLKAKRDILICAFGSRYLRAHKEKHFILVTSRKMRELARLLIEISSIKPSIKTLFDALKPENYDALVTATQAASKYDCDTQSYKSPTFALNMGTTLKQCCEIALVHVLKKSEMLPSIETATTEAGLKTLIQLIEGNWRFDVSTQALNDLNIRKWNVVTLVPLAADLKLLKECLINTGNNSMKNLKRDTSDVKSYLTLLETVYCRLLLLNRRRPGELQRLLITTYKSACENQNEQAYEEFAEAVSETEKVLMKSFLRIVIRGKRGRGVPVLITKDVKEHLDLLLQCRDKVFTKSNCYLFGNPKSSEPIIGYKILKKYATLCGAKNPDALTCTRLRKHLATLTQLFHLSENDMEQLASFMGHTLGIHRSSYRLPDDVYQTARISKLLLLMEKGEAGHYKGKNLDDIDFNLDENLVDEASATTTETQNELELCIDTEEEPTTSTNNENTNTGKKITTRKGKRQVLPWTESQKEVVVRYFKKHISKKQPPKKAECELLISKYPELLNSKGWLRIKVFIQNMYSGRIK